MNTEPRCVIISRVGTLMLSLLPLFVAAGEPQWQPPTSIRQSAEAFALELLGNRPGITVESVSVDDRLRLPACNRALTTGSDRAFRNGRGTVTVSCDGSQPWRLFVPIRTSHLIDVVVTRRAIQRNETIGADAVMLETRSSTTLPFQYATSLQDVVGMTVRRSIVAGTVLAPAAVQGRKIVVRGGLVTLTAERGGIMVSGEGTALQDGVLGQRVRVRSRGGRVVEGFVAGENRVRVGG
jgi:flagella basal body P-ring formation protein FlgA